MATLAQIEEGIRRANAKGDTEAVKKLGMAYRAMSANVPRETPAEVADEPKPDPKGSDWVSQITSGVNEGIATGLGAPVDVTATILNLGSSGINTLFGTEIPQITDPVGGSGTFRSLLAPTIQEATDDPAKQFVRRASQDVGASMLPMGLGGRVANAPGLIAAQLGLGATSGVGAATAEQVFPENKAASMIGQALGTVTGLGGAKALRKAITPFEIGAERQAANDVMAREGIELTAGQQTGNKALRYTESELGGGQIGDITERQAQQFTSAALRRAGVSAQRATPEVMDDAFTNIGREFDGLAARNNLTLDPQLGADLRQVVTDYRSLVPDTQQARIVNDLLGDIVIAAQRQGGRTLDGAFYQATRSRIERMARSAQSDPQLAETLRGIRGALDDAMERTIAQTNPDDLGAWRQVRRDYRNLLVLERAAQGAGEDAAMGIISPAKLRTAADAILGHRSNVRGTNDFAELTQAGQATMTPLPQSGTAPRLAVRGVTSGIPTAVGAVMGNGVVPGIGALLGGAAGASAPYIIGKALLSRPGRAYLTNNLLRGRQDIARALGGPASAMLTNLVSE